MESTPLVTSNADTLLVKRQKLLLLSRKVSMMKRDGLPFYRPHPKQDLFHRATAIRRGAFTGNRFGKSTMGCAEDCAWVRGERPWYATDDITRRSGIPQRPVKGLIITTDWDKAKEIWSGQDGKLWKFLPKDGFVKSSTRNHSGAVDTIFFANGSSLRFDTVKSFMSNPMGSESSDWDFIHGDEPFPEQMWKAVSRGLVDRNGSAWFTLTALSEPWITDAFAEDGNFRSSMFSVEGSIFDNPYLTEQAIRMYEATLTDDEKECRLYGKPLHKVGLVYKEFQRHRHVLDKLPSGWKDWITPPEEWPVYSAIDYHPQTPHAMLFVTVDPHGRRFYYYDIYLHCSTEELAKQHKLATKDRFVVWNKLDPYAWINDPITESNAATELDYQGLYCEKATKALTQGILRVQGELKKTPETMFFGPMCRRTLWEIQRYHWDERGENTPVDKDDHMMENLYRLELSEPRYIERNTNSKPIEDIEITKPDFTLEPVVD